MRFAKFIGILLVALTAQVGYAQVQPENAISAERDLNESVHIFPNPAVEYVHVKVDHLPASQITLSIHNILGNEMNIETEVVDEHELRVRVKEFATGYYFVAIKDADSNFRKSFKFLKRER